MNVFAFLTALTISFAVSVEGLVCPSNRQCYTIGTPIQLTITRAMIGNATQITMFYWRSTGPANQSANIISIPYTPSNPIAISSTGTKVTIQFNMSTIDGGSTAVFESYQGLSQVVAVTSNTSMMEYVVSNATRWLNLEQTFNPDPSAAPLPDIYVDNGMLANMLPKTFLLNVSANMQQAISSAVNISDMSLYTLQLISIANAEWTVYARMQITSISVSNLSAASIMGTWNLSDFKQPQGSLLYMLAVRPNLQSKIVPYFGLAPAFDYRAKIRQASVVVGPAFNLSLMSSQVNQYGSLDVMVNNGGVSSYWYIGASDQVDPTSMTANNYFLSCAPVQVGNMNMPMETISLDWRTANVMVGNTQGGMALPVGMYYLFLVYSQSNAIPPMISNVGTLAMRMTSQTLTVQRASTTAKTPIMLNNGDNRQIKWSSTQGSSIQIEIYSIFSQVYFQWALQNTTNGTNSSTPIDTPLLYNVSQPRMKSNISVMVPTSLLTNYNKVQVRLSAFVYECASANASAARKRFAQTFVDVTIQNAAPSSGTKKSNKLSAGAIAGIVIGCVVFVACVVGVVVYFKRAKGGEETYRLIGNE